VSVATGAGTVRPRRPGPTAGVVRRSRRLLWYVPAVIVFIGALVLWELLVTLLNLRAFVLPRPTAIAAAFVANWNGGDPRFVIGAAARATIVEAFGGLVIGTTAGLLVAFATARWASARDVLLPLAVAANAVPIIAFSPLLNSWFGLANPLSKMMMAAVLVFFPVMANVTRGLVQVDPAALELMRSMAASESTILRKVRIPNALPYFFTALKLATTLSLIGAIVAEYFGSATRVLGRLIVESSSSLRFDITWAAILVGAAAGILMYLAVVVLERVFMPWHVSVRSPEP
jgi:NitT/TauT family transport system permease protein